MSRGRHGSFAACGSAARLSGPLRAARRTAVEHFDQHFARTGHAAFDRADRTATDGSGFLVGQPTCAHEQERGALARRQRRERAVQFAQLKFRVVVGQDARFGQRRGVDANRLEFLAAQLRVVLIAQNRKQPGFEVGAGLKRSILLNARNKAS